jgi:hypothetical protein
MREIAYSPHLNDTWLGSRRAIFSRDEPPTPLGPNTAQSCLLLLSDFSDWSPVVLDDGRSIKFYTVIPIYTEERDLAVDQGLPALLERLLDREISAVVDVTRENVAGG